MASTKLGEIFHWTGLKASIAGEGVDESLDSDTDLEVSIECEAEELIEEEREALAFEEALT